MKAQIFLQLTNIVKQIVTYEKLGILTPIEGVFFSHAFLKACQYATSNENITN
jgi:hypothetical protein